MFNFRKTIKLLSVVMCFTVLFSSSAYAKKEVTTELDTESVSGRITNSVLEYPDVNKSFRYDMFTHYVAITECLSSDANIVVPDTINNLPVLMIEDNVFKDHVTIESVIMSNNIISIGESAFEGCTELKNVTLSNNLETIGKDAFADCENLRTITIPGGIQYIDAGTFDGCSRLISVTFEEATTEFFDKDGSEIGRSIKSGAFKNCLSLQTAWLPGDITSIDKDAFSKSEEFLTIYGEVRSTAAQFASEHLLDFEIITRDAYGEMIKTLTKVKVKDVSETVMGYDWYAKLETINVMKGNFKYTSSAMGAEYKSKDESDIVVCGFVVKNVKTSKAFFNPLDIVVEVDGYSRKISSFGSLSKDLFEGHETFLCGEVEKNSVIYGYIAFEVPSDWANFTVKFAQDVRMENSIFSIDRNNSNIVFSGSESSVKEEIVNSDTTMAEQADQNETLFVENVSENVATEDDIKKETEVSDTAVTKNN